MIKFLFFTIICLSHPAAFSSDLSVLIGRWTYRSLINDPNPNTDFNILRFGVGIMTIESIENGDLKGSLDFGPTFQMALTGKINDGQIVHLMIHGIGISRSNRDWAYDYESHLSLKWPNGVNQRPTLLGSVIRSAPHSGGTAQAGFVASWVAVKQ